MNKLTLFMQVVERLSFSRAAEQTGIPKSTVSRKISELEEHLGCRLLERSTRKLRMTETGARLYHTYLPLLEQIGSVEDEIMQTQTVPQGKLRITANGNRGRS